MTRKRAKTHVLLDGRRVDLGELTAHERRFLNDVERMKREDASYFEICRFAVGPGSPSLQGRNRVDRKLVESPLYLTAEDIATRAGIEQGLILAPEYDHQRTKFPTDGSMMNVTMAANTIGMTRAAVHKAINKGTLDALRVGNVILVKRADVAAYIRGREAREEAKPAKRGRAA